ncbi:cytochrome P450 [Streptomyces sp. NPDC047022]|uniref:cytochrome P450 n=1 Tax=Streptomyces sp. NPDC047022 TaxID=3155737 RepID=UPI0033E53B0F
MTEETITEPGVDFEPVLAELMREDGPVARLAPCFVPRGGSDGLAESSGEALRRAVAPAFTAQGIERVRERSGRMLGELVDELLQDGPPADLTATVLGPFALAVSCELMGVPAADRQNMRTWTQLVLDSPPGARVGERAAEEMSTYFAALIGLREGGTGQDIGSLLGSAVSRGEVTPDEAVGLSMLLQIGGEAVAEGIGQLFHVLLTRPELAERLRAGERQSRYLAVEELLCRILQRDPGSLAGVTAGLVVDALLERVPGLRLAVPPDQVPFREGAFMRGPEALPVMW